MAKYEVILVKYPNLEPPDNLWWTAVCPAMPGVVSDGLTQEEALLMIADCMALHLDEEPGEKPLVFDAEQTEYEKKVALVTYEERGGITELHRVEPRFMTDEEMRANPRFADLFDPVA